MNDSMIDVEIALDLVTAAARVAEYVKKTRYHGHELDYGTLRRLLNECEDVLSKSWRHYVQLRIEQVAAAAENGNEEFADEILP